MTKLGVIVPTRSRPQNVGPIVEAWWATGAFDVADLWFAYDNDDMEASVYKRQLASMAEVKAMQHPEWQPLVPKLNRDAVALARYYGYPYVAFMGDDHIPRTQRWAHMLVENHMTSGKRIWYGQDGLQNERLPTWWSMDSRIVTALGRMVPAPVQHLFCDNAVLELGKAAETIGYDERILIEHMHPVAGKAKMDEQYVRVNRAQQYERDSALFRGWLRDGMEADATLVQSLGG